jgi:NAD(P)-dependent dehydrogenase (short-subunit alcohol dehydrogenase family)
MATPGERLSGRVAVITGAASGMGAESARLFAREGASVLLADIQESLGETVAAEIRAAGGAAVFQRADVLQERDIVSMLETAVERFGRLDILFNNAGGGVMPSGTEGETTLERMSIEDWDRSHALNLRSVFLGVKYALPHLRKAGGGVILTTSSDAGLRGIRGNDAYNTHKAGVNMLTQSLAQTLAPFNIRINAIAPGWIGTPMLRAAMPPEVMDKVLPIAQPIERAGEAADIARAALFLASDDASFITGHVLPVDGGWIVQGDQNSRLTLFLAGRDKPEWS